MNIFKRIIAYFTKQEIVLWSVSALCIMVSFVIFDRANVMTLIASLIGVTSLIFTAKGNPIGQFLMVVFSIFYGIISYNYAYYGEMVTYLGMTMPMAVFALIAWLRHPFKGNKAQVTVNHIGRKETVFMFVLAGAVTAAFYFILRALAYATNDIVLIIMWILACMDDIKYISVIVCFVAFLFNDLYGFISWRKMAKAQHSDTVS